MKRRNFISLAAGAAVASVLPSTPHPSYNCSCNLVTYEWSGDHYAASHILLHGQLTRFDYRWFCWHNALHRKSRMWMLIEIAKHRKLSVDEREEIQRAFIAVGANDARMRESE